VVVPLMFGYMFGDVGQGLVIAAAGFALRHRYPIAKLFVSGGLAAAAFGLLFGSVFSVHAFTPLWVAPLDAPLAVLAAPLGGRRDAATLGLALDGLEAWWRGELKAWLATDLGYVVAYLGLAGRLRPSVRVRRRGTGRARQRHRARRGRARRLVAGATGSPRWPSASLQILINTLSFARVGAFALAHAGLSSAIVALADAADSSVARVLVLVVGNADRARARDARRLDPDDAPRAVRVLRPLPRRRRPRVPPAAGAAVLPQESQMKPASMWSSPAATLAAVARRRDGPARLPRRRRSPPPQRRARRCRGRAWTYGLHRRGAADLRHLVARRRLRGRQVGTAAIGALAEKPELFARLLIFVGLAEGIAIYGLIVVDPDPQPARLKRDDRAGLPWATKTSGAGYALAGVERTRPRARPRSRSVRARRARDRAAGHRQRRCRGRHRCARRAGRDARARAAGARSCPTSRARSRLPDLAAAFRHDLGLEEGLVTHDRPPRGGAARPRRGRSSPQVRRDPTPRRGAQPPRSGARRTRRPRDRVRAAFAEERARARRAARRAPRANLETRRRAAANAFAAAQLAAGLARLPQGLAARWRDDAARRTWIDARATPRPRGAAAGAWRVAHAPGWPRASARDALLERSAARGTRVTFDEVDALVAGLKVAAHGNVVDAHARRPGRRPRPRPGAVLLRALETA
jgi:hypothetical protein